jgi:hypothetical protein
MFNAITQIMNLFGPQQAADAIDRPAIAPPPGAVQVDPAVDDDRFLPADSGRLADDVDYYVDDEARQDDANGNGNGDNGQTTTTASPGVTPPPGSVQVEVSTVGTSTIPGLICVPVASCPVPNIYGTRPAHFLRFGFVSPSAVRCDATAGQILCVQEAGAATTTAAGAETTTATTEAETTTTEATTTTTTEGATTTTQEAETTTAAATTAAAAGTPPPPTVQMLECRRVADCAVVFGTQAAHFTRYGEQAACSNGMVRCVTARPAAEATTPTPPVFTAGPPPSPAGLPVGPVAPSVSIIGPQPIYVSYNNVIGPTVGGCCGGGVGDIGPGKVSSSGASPAQEREINSLLQGLRTRLQSIITSFRS